MAANGDTANKIGTYQIAIVAKYHEVPFYVAAPLTSIDMSLTSGEKIKIEVRPDREMTHIGEHRIAAAGNSSNIHYFTDVVFTSHKTRLIAALFLIKLIILRT